MTEHEFELAVDPMDSHVYLVCHGPGHWWMSPTSIDRTIPDSEIERMRWEHIEDVRDRLVRGIPLEWTPESPLQAIRFRVIRKVLTWLRRLHVSSHS